MTRSFLLRAAAVLALLAGLLSTAAAVEVETLWSLRFLGGQYFFEGERANLSGNLSGRLAPVFILSDRWVLMPSLSADYHGTKQVVDLVGAGSIFQERMDHRASLKGVYRRSESKWSFKPYTAYSQQLLKETKDEDWFEGLFDYRRVSLGIEAERMYKEPYSVRFGYGWSTTQFPNYTSLESESAYDFRGQPLARELVGDEVLNTNIHMLTAGLSAPLRGWAVIDARLVFERRGFPNQPLADAAGDLTSDNREDFVTLLGGAVRVPFEPDPSVRIEGSLGLRVADSVSNQGSYDASQAKFTPRYYNYVEFGVSPGVRVSMGDTRQPIVWSMEMDWSRRRYSNRPIQDEAGVYREESLSQRAWTLSTTLSYPMAPRLRVLFNLQHGRAASNQGFEQFYNYNYSATNYMIGFSYDH